MADNKSPEAIDDGRRCQVLSDHFVSFISFDSCRGDGSEEQKALELQHN